MSFKCLRATYTMEVFFKIPKNIDLGDEKQVKSYNVKWNTLYIELTNGKIIVIEPSCDNTDMKYADFTDILDRDETGFDEDEFEDADIEPEKPKPAEEEPEVVKKIYVDGKIYLVSKKTNIVYDYDKYINDGEQIILGKYNGTTIDFDDDKTDNWCECCLCGKELTDEKSTLIDDDGATICVCLECANE